MTTWILAADAALDSPHAGGKARALARAERAGLPVPVWCVLSDAACGADPSLSLTADIRREIALALKRLCPNGEPVAVRSSAGDEDGRCHSFAGQLESFLHVRHEEVADRVRAVWRSAFTPRVIAYRRERGLSGAPRPPAVILQRMVAPRVAGVAFSADPVSGRRGVAVVSAVQGMGAALVSGETDADTWLVDRDGTILERRVGTAPGAPVLADDQIIAVAGLARAAAHTFGCPQDVEWAIADQLVLLQSRPITSLRTLADPDGCLAIWDNSNIVESYSGVTTPLTFSFAREIYPPVYRQFCRLMGVPSRAIERHDDIFQNVLGLVRGRMYYNLLNWYRILALLPGYRLNRQFMEQMMGVEEALPEALADEIARAVRGGWLVERGQLARTAVGLVVNYCRLNRRVHAFYRRLDVALAPSSPAIAESTPDELVAHYRGLRRRLLLDWDAPLVNDFFAMIFYGLLRRLVTRWCGDLAGTLQNDLIGGEGGMVSAEPAILMQNLARCAAPHPSLVDRLMTGTVPAIDAALAQHGELRAGCRQYLARFGDRTVNELKLESTTLHDDPLPLFRAIGALARQMAAAPAADEADVRPPSPGDRLRSAARVRVAGALAGHPLRRLVFHWVLRQARRRVRDRENLRLERTRLFARVRQIFLALGRQLHALDLIGDPRDVLYLEVDEVLAFVDGRSTCRDLRALTAVRRREFREYEDGPAPDSRFETRGPVYQGHDYRRTRPRPASVGDERRGLGCSPGVVRGPVRLVSDPNTVDLRERSILVAPHTDPGWIMVFPSALAVIVERGSLLSHAAIVARELGIPAVVSMPGVMQWLEDGDWVELDGSTGRPAAADRVIGDDRLNVEDMASDADARRAVAHA
jgi:phosphohistidine swiveling domain-containing protein